MPAPSDRQAAFRSTVVYNLGAEAGVDLRWNPRTQIPTLASFQPVRRLAARLGLSLDAWLFEDGATGALEACQGRWRPAVAALAFDIQHGGVPSVAASAGAFERHILPLERAQGTRWKYGIHRLSILTWAIWKGQLAHLLPMSPDLLRAYLWDSLAFEASHSVLKHAIDAVKAWHRRLGSAPPLDGPGDYTRLTNSLARFQPVPRVLKFPIHAEAVRRLLLLSVPAHPACAGVRPPRPQGKWARCPICWAFLHRWVDCLAGALLTLICSRCKEGGLLQTCDIWWRYDELAGYLQFTGGAAFDVKVRKNDQFRFGHQARVGVARDPRLDILAQLREIIRLLDSGPRPGCTKNAERGVPCAVCPPLFPRRIKRGQEFDFSRPASSGEMSAMISRGLGHVGFDTSLFSGISARRGGLSTAIERGVPEHILWMQSGHAQDVAARRYVQLNSPALLYSTWAAFGL